MVNKSQAVTMAAIGLVVIAVVVAATLFFSYRVSTWGTISSVGCEIFADQECTQLISGVDWGSVEPGGQSDVTFFIRNNGTRPVTLDLNTSNYNPVEAEPFISLTWSYNGQTLESWEVAGIDLVLHISPDISGIQNFAFDITVTATTD